MSNPSIFLERYNTIPSDYQEILLKGISDFTFQKKGFPPLQSFSIFIKNQQQNVLGGISGVILHGSLHIDSLWVDESLRHQGWGTKLMQEAEEIGKKGRLVFITVNTMEWEGLPFYQKLGCSIEFTRDGYSENSKMFLLRKNLDLLRS